VSDLGIGELRRVGYSIHFEAELFTGIDEGVYVAERIEHPDLA